MYYRAFSDSLLARTAVSAVRSVLARARARAEMLPEKDSSFEVKCEIAAPFRNARFPIPDTFQDMSNHLREDEIVPR